MRLKTFCACLTLVTYAGIAMEPPSDGEMRSAGKGKATAENRSGPIDQANLENFSKEELLREIARLRQENTDLRQKVKKHESVLDEVLDETIHTRDKKVLKKEYGQLVRAVENEDTEKLKSFIDQGVDIDETVYGKYFTPLIVAIKNGKVDTVKFLLNNGTDLKKSPKALEYAVENGNVELVKLLLNNGADLKKSPKALEFAVWTGKKDLVKLLLEKGADLKKSPKALEYAVENGNVELVKLLLNNGADLKKSPKALEYAVENGNVELVKLLLNNGADLKKYPKALESAVKTGEKDLVKLLLEKGADPNVLDENGNSMLILALEEGYAEIAKMFLSGSDNNLVLDLIYSGKNKMPMSDDDIRFRERLASFKHYDTPNNRGESPLMHAISSKKISDSDLQGIVKSLLKNGADVNRTDSSGMSALKLAKEAKRSEKIIKLLKDAGAIEYKQDNNEKSPVVRLYEYIKSSRDLSLSDLKFVYELGNKGLFMCTLRIKDEKFELKGKMYDTKRAAKNAIAEHALKELLKRKASSSEANQPSSSN